MFGDVIKLHPARRKVINIQAKVVVTKSTPLAYLEELESITAAALRKGRRLGQALAFSWIIKLLHTEKITSVQLNSPVADIAIDPDQYADVGIIQLRAG